MLPHTKFYTLKTAILSKKTKRLITFILLIILAFTVSKKIFSKDKRLKETENEVRELKQTKMELKQQLQEAQTREYIEKESLERLNMAYPGETVVIIPEKKNKQQDDIVEDEESSWWKEIFLMFK